uniref:SCP domain-containing protein n=1 Tax=Peronospora matthiolae TaxID=2874970 RepID=A0AAV1T953_9STRA
MVYFALLTTSAIAATSFLPATAGVQLGNGGGAMWADNCRFGGNYYKAREAIPPRCGSACAGDSVCTHWVWNNLNGGTCWLMSGARSAKTEKLATSCGYVVSSNAQVQQRAPGQAASAGQALSAGQAAPPAQAAPSALVSPNSGLTAAEMNEMLRRINTFRAQNGLGALTIDRQLVAASASQSQDQARRYQMTHASSNGQSLGGRISAQGYDFAVVTENVAAGQTSVESVMTSWQNSPDHRANLLDPDVINVGFAKVVNRGCNGYKTYWTQDFGRRD